MLITAPYSIPVAILQRLRRDERPKGVGVMPGQSPMVPEGVFILVGRPQTTDTTFLPASNREVYDLGLHFYPFQLPGKKRTENLHYKPVLSI